MESWERYRRWNEAVATTVFPELSDPVPVYLDLEDDVLAALASAAGHQGPPRDGLQEAVRGVTVAGDTFSIGPIWRRQREWRAAKAHTGPPPSLALLSLTVLAAEDMGNSDDGFDPLNYYSRLCSLLKVAPNSVEVRHGYMKRAEQLWGDLNRWLEQMEGLRGTPTAYALTFRYVGLPMSQALVRAGDRRKFPLFFTQYGLAAGMELAPEAVERYLDAWFGSDSCPASASLKRLWAKPSARERIATVAAVELRSWDGTIEAGQESDAPLFQRVGLMAQMRRGFMESSLDVALTVRGLGDDGFDGQMQIESADGQWLPLSFAPAVANLWRTSYIGGLDVTSVLEGVVRIRPRWAQDKVFQHHPRSIVPLVFDELQSAFLEQERLQLNVDCMLLLRTHPNGRVVAEVADVLASCARPGFSVEDRLDGLPEGWVLIAGVQLYGAPGPTKHNELVPLARDQLTIAGGMRIPSRVRKWSALAAPEIRASVESATSLRLILTDLETEQSVKSWSSGGGALVVPLAEADLNVGDYRVALYAGDSRHPIQQATVRLRSADAVDPGWYLAPRLTYALSEPGGPLGAITAMEVSPDQHADAFVDGAVANGAHYLGEVVEATATAVWSEPRHEVVHPATFRIGSPDPESCVLTGAHYLIYPPFLGGLQPKYIEGVCRYCGLVKRSPGWAKKKKLTWSQKSVARVDVAGLPPVEVTTDELWDSALDTLMHLGGGPSTTLSSVSSQIDGSALFTSAFPVLLETLGHIAIERRPEGAPMRWEVSPSCLVEVPDGLELIGFWPDRLVGDVLSVLVPFGGRLERCPVEGRPTRRWIEGIDPETAALKVGHLITVSTDVPTAMLSTLPPLSQLATQLPREPLPGFAQAERYEVSSSSWMQTNDVSTPGAYRLTRGFERIHLFRSEQDVQDGLAARASVYLVKHLAANASRKSLPIYLSRQASVAVPRGCDLPGLYARAIVMASGELPHPGTVTIGQTKRPCLVYSGISEEQANLLVTLLSR